MPPRSQSIQPGPKAHRTPGWCAVRANSDAGGEVAAELSALTAVLAMEMSRRTNGGKTWRSVSPPALEEARKKKEENAGRRMASKSGRLPLGAANLVSKAWPFFTSILYPSPTFLFHRSRDIFRSSRSHFSIRPASAPNGLKCHPHPSGRRRIRTRPPTPVPTVPLQRKIAAAIPCPSCFLSLYLFF